MNKQPVSYDLAGDEILESKIQHSDNSDVQFLSQLAPKVEQNASLEGRAQRRLMERDDRLQNDRFQDLSLEACGKADAIAEAQPTFLLSNMRDSLSRDCSTGSTSIEMENMQPEHPSDSTEGILRGRDAHLNRNDDGGVHRVIQATVPDAHDNKNSHSYDEESQLKSVDMEHEPTMQKESANAVGESTTAAANGAASQPSQLHGFYLLLFSLIKSIIGSGILLLPHNCFRLGAVPSSLLLLFSAFCSGFGLMLYLWLCSKVGRNSSIKTLSDITYKRLGVAFNVIIVVKCFLVAAFYIKLASSYLYRRLFIAPLGSWQHVLFRIIVAFSILPFVLLTQIGKLRFISYFSFAAVLFLVAFSVMLVSMFGNDPLFPDATSGGQRKFVAFPEATFDTLIAFFTLLPSFMFAFTCHQNVFPIYNEARNNSMRNMRNLVFIGISISLSIYLLFMFCSLGTFGQYLKGHDVILDAYASALKTQRLWIHRLGIACEIVFAIVLLFSVPTQTLPLKGSFMSVLPMQAATLHRWKRELNWMISLGTIVFSLTVLLTVEKIQIFVALIGAVCSPLLMAVVPSFYYLKLTKATRWNFRRVSVLVFAIFGIILIGLCTAASVYSIVVNWSKKP